MASTSFNPKKLGIILLPEKIFGFPYQEKLFKVFEKSRHDRLHSEIIFYFYVSSFFVAFIAYMFLIDGIYFMFESMMTSFLSMTLVFTISYFILQVICYWAILFGYFTRFDAKMQKHEADVERDLPDFLDNLVSNLKGGYVLEKALIKSVRPDQKALLDEMTLINEKVMSGTSVGKALDEMQQNFKSPVLARTLFLIVEGVKGGGNLVVPLQRISDNLKKIYLLNDEVKSSVGGFSIIIKMIGGYVAPALFALAITLLVFIGDMLVLLSQSQVDSTSLSEIPQDFVDSLVYFSYAMLGLISVFSSLIIAQLNGDEMHTVIKKIPITLIISFLLYAILSNAMISYFSNII